MNKVITIHLHGVAFQLEEGGYDALRAYLDQAARQLAANPDKAEILDDIEQAIADKFRARLSANRNVVLADEVQAVITAMGPVTDSAETGPDTAAANATPGSAVQPGTSTTTESPRPPRRLYRLYEGAMISGVCNGLAAYLGVDVTLIRLVVVVLTFVSFGTVAIAYGVGALVVPEAKTAEQKAAASSPAPTAQEFIRMAREGYYAGMKSFPDREARREWKRKFHREMRDWRRAFRHGATCPPPVAPQVPPAPPPVGYQLAFPLLSTLKTMVHLVALFFVIVLISTGRIFGVPLPGNLPVWAGVVLILLLANLVLAPIKAMRRAYYARLVGWPFCINPFAELLHGVVVVLLVVFGLWLADRLVPGFHDILLSIPVFCQNLADAVQQWWTHR